MHAGAPQRHLAKQVPDEEVARILRPQEGDHPHVGGKPVEDLPRVVRERVPPFRGQIEPDRARVEDGLPEEEDPDQRRDGEHQAQALCPGVQCRPRHCRASSTRSVPHTKQPAVNRK